MKKHVIYFLLLAILVSNSTLISNDSTPNNASPICITLPTQK